MILVTSDLPRIRTLSHTFPRAKHEHVCSVCAAPIPAGEKHERFVIVDCDDLSSHLKTIRTHIYCPSLV